MKFVLIIFCLTMLGCSHSSSQQSGTLSAKFASYKATVSTPAEHKFVKAELWETLVASRVAAAKSEVINAIAYFPLEMTKITDVKESISGTRGCLLVSGTNAKQVLLDYYIQFDLTDGNWLISDVAIKYFLDGSERYLPYAECDAEKRMTLWLESVQ